MSRKHRLQKDVPVDPLERRALLRWIDDHPAWNRPTPHGPSCESSECIDINWAHVDPVTRRIEDDDARNTHFEVWVEAGPLYDLEDDAARNNLPAPPGGWDWMNKWGCSHDTDLDCGADDMETALLTLATLVEVFYDPTTGKDRDNRPTRCEGTWKDDDVRAENWISGCDDAGDGFCVRCGFHTT